MKYNQNITKKWFNELETSFPQLPHWLLQNKTPTLVIGACVFDLYAQQGWIPPLTRKTGDLDLSIQVSANGSIYKDFISKLENANYKKDSTHHYRYHPPVKYPGALTYVDMLAHPSKGFSEKATKALMSVGDDFNLSGFEFAKLKAYEIVPHLLFPNPFAFAYLKRISYINAPDQRRRDLADLIELGSGLVTHETHFECDELWNSISHTTESQELRETYEELASGESSRWDIEEVEQELKLRGFTINEIQELIPQRLKDLVDIVMTPYKE